MDSTQQVNVGRANSCQKSVFVNIMNKCVDNDSEIVISGISGRYPKSDDISEFWKNLVEGNDMVSNSHDRYDELGLLVPSRMGVINSLDKFDADFFSVHTKLSNVMDPRLRKLLELSHEAILDAGVIPESIRGSNTAVFVAFEDSASCGITRRSKERTNLYSVVGNESAMLSNRLSYNFGLTGSSMSINTACSSSITAIHQALLAIQVSLCDAALVAGAHCNHDPVGSFMYHGLEMTSVDGKCKAFDAGADGFVQAEAAVAIYICKMAVAKRAYVTLVHAAINCDGYKEEGITFPSKVQQENVMRKVYEETGVNPHEVEYVEAHGTGTKVGDPQELNAIASVFCNGKKGPLLVGSVKSNMGHSEPAAGLCGISKLILSHMKGILPANLHYSSPNPEIPALIDGRVKVVDRNLEFKAKYASLNSIGYGGTNAHILLKFQNEEDVRNQWQPSIPLIILCSGRTEFAVQHFLDEAVIECQDQHFVKLLHELSREILPRQVYRGYVIVKFDEIESSVDKTEFKDSVWFIFSGVGSQWVGMAKDMITFDVFKKSIMKSNEYLANAGFSLMDLLESTDPTTFDGIKNSMVGVNSYQVALVDLLKSIGIRPNGIIGHSNGEVASGYADECLTQEQTVMIALTRARTILEADVPPGTLASVGLTWEEAKKRCPEGIYPACYNAKENVTIAGSPELINKFMKELQSEGIFVKSVRAAQHGYHSPLVYKWKTAAEKLLQLIIPNQTLRSKRWLSSSVPEHMWNEDVGKYSSAEYYVNNGINPVFFYPALLHIPENVVALEVAPHCFMLSILKKSLPKSCISLGLVNVKSPNNCVYFLTAIGQCHLHGIHVDVGELYEKVEFPVRSRTPCISPLIKWDHSESWYTPHNSKEIGSKKQIYTINMLDKESSFFVGHSIDGKVIFPATGYLWLAWRFFSSEQNSNVDKCPVYFQNIRFERVTFMDPNHETEFLVNILHASGNFEVLESDQVVCAGLIGRIEGPIISSEVYKSIYMSTNYMCNQDFYKEMHLRGYGHSGQFQGIQQIDVEGKWACVEWPGHWVTFMDAVLQTYLLQTKNRNLQVPIRIKKLFVDPLAVSASLETHENQIKFKASTVHDRGGCPGLEIQGLSFARFNQRHNELVPTISEQDFIPYTSTKIAQSQRHAWTSCIEIAMDNSRGSKFVFTEILTNIGNTISHLVSDQSQLSFPTIDCTTVNKMNAKIDYENFTPISKVTTLQNLQSEENNNLVFIDSSALFPNALAFVKPGGFLLCTNMSFEDKDTPGFIQISTKHVSDSRIEFCLHLLRKVTVMPKIVSVITVTNNDFNWVETAKDYFDKSANEQCLLFVSNFSKCGIIGFVKCLVKEQPTKTIRCYQTIDKIQLNFENPNKYLQNQLKKDLVYNVCKNGEWGYVGNQSIPLEQFQFQHDSHYSYANVMKTGELSSLSWIASPLSLSKSNLVEVEYSSLNFKDVMVASGRLNQASTMEPTQDDYVLGIEFSGKYKGQGICGMGVSQCLATYVGPDDLLLFDKPKIWSYEEAATVPTVYVTVYLALVIRGRMKPGESILVHAGSGGVGQAAIAVALSMNCKVFTSVSTRKKRNFLKMLFPCLKDESFTNSRNADEFKTHIQIHTNGKGVDLVLNSLAEENLKASIDCLADHGRFLEIGKFDLFNDTNIGLSVLLKGASIFGVHVEKFLDHGPSDEVGLLKVLVNDGIMSGVVCPLNSHVFKRNQLEDAFRFMAQGKHIGKVLLDLKEHGNVPVSIPAYKRTYFYSHKSYIIIGGLGGMGFELANWMVSRGAKNLILVSRTGVKSTYHEYRIKIWEKQGTSVVISSHDVTTIEGAKDLFDDATTLGPIGGLFNTAVVLKDAMFENQTPATFIESANSKAVATSNLDTLSRTLAPELDYFAVFSSITAGRGNPGQTNYGYSNSVMERICEQRHADGLPGLAIQWGAVGDVGVLHRQIGNRGNFAGLIPQKLKSCIETLDLFLQQRRPVVSSFLAFKEGNLEESSSNDSLVETVARILGIQNVSRVNPSSTLVDLGMDSLMGAEISQVLSSRGNIQLSGKPHGQITFELLAQLDKGKT